MFKNATDQGHRWAVDYIKENRSKHEFLDEIIFVGMAINPFTTAKTKADFNEAVSEIVNRQGRSETKKAIYGAISPLSVSEAYK